MAKSMAQRLSSFPVCALGLVTKSNTLLRSIMLKKSGTYVSLFFQTERREQRSSERAHDPVQMSHIGIHKHWLHMPGLKCNVRLPTQEAPRSQSQGTHRGICRSNDVSALRSPSPVLILRKLKRVSNKRRSFGGLLRNVHRTSVRFCARRVMHC